MIFVKNMLTVHLFSNANLPFAYLSYIICSMNYCYMTQFDNFIIYDK